MNTGMLLLIGMALFGIAIGLIGCFLGAAESAERRLRESRRLAREPWDAESIGEVGPHAIGLSGPTPTG
jgi:hypothetical protein